MANKPNLPIAFSTGFVSAISTTNNLVGINAVNKTASVQDCTDLDPRSLQSFINALENANSEIGLTLQTRRGEAHGLYLPIGAYNYKAIVRCLCFPEIVDSVTNKQIRFKTQIIYETENNYVIQKPLRHILANGPMLDIREVYDQGLLTKEIAKLIKYAAEHTTMLGQQSAAYMFARYSYAVLAHHIGFGTSIPDGFLEMVANA